MISFRPLQLCRPVHSSGLLSSWEEENCLTPWWYLAEAVYVGLCKGCPSDAVHSDAGRKVALCLGCTPILHFMAVFFSHVPLGRLTFPAENAPIPFLLAALVSIMLK